MPLQIATACRPSSGCTPRRPFLLGPAAGGGDVGGGSDDGDGDGLTRVALAALFTLLLTRWR